MDIVILGQSDVPIYEQIYRQISSQIISGKLEAGACLPSIRAVANELGISIITVKNAYEKLEWNGFIYTRAGKGCFVSDEVKNLRDTKKLELAAQKLKPDIAYCKSMNVTLDELIEILKREYDK